MGEKRKARMTNNERQSKKEKKSINSVAPSTSNDDIEEQASLHSNSSTSDSNSQQPSIIQGENQPEEIEESQTITPIDVEHIPNEDPIESSPLVTDDNNKTTSTTTTKSWWSSLVRLFHFSHSTNDTKTQIDNLDEHSSSAFDNGNYLGNVKCRRSLHGDSFVG